MAYYCENLRDKIKCAFGCLHRTDDICCLFCDEEDCPSRCSSFECHNLEEKTERKVFTGFTHSSLSEILIGEISKRSREIDSISSGKLTFTIKNGYFIRGEINCTWEKEEDGSL